MKGLRLVLALGAALAGGTASTAQAMPVTLLVFEEAIAKFSDNDRAGAAG